MARCTVAHHVLVSTTVPTPPYMAPLPTPSSAVFVYIPAASETENSPFSRRWPHLGMLPHAWNAFPDNGAEGLRVLYMGKEGKDIS